jgi:hypothetical protein
VRRPSIAAFSQTRPAGATISFMPPPLDTTPEIEAMQIRIFRAMTIEQHLHWTLEISLLSRALMRAGVRRDHPDWSDKEIEREVHRLSFFPQPLPDWVR